MYDPNEQFRIAEFVIGTLTTRVYVLQAGQTFERFGGSSRGLTVNRTPSLITSQIDEARGITDREFDINDRSAWAEIFRLHALSITKGK